MNRSKTLKPGDSDYERLAKEEILHYNEIFLGADASPSAQTTLMQPVPASWIEVETRASSLVRQTTGSDLSGHVLSRLRAAQQKRMLSLGSGPGGIELAFAREARTASITCMDLNPELARLGQERANQEGLNVAFEICDLNTINLPNQEYDIVFCHASLHHVLELEHVAGEISKSLRDGGVLITVDVCTRNGYLMWPETREVVRTLFNALPSRFRINHTAGARPKVDDSIWEADTSAVSMECIRAEDIIPVLAKTFQVQQFVPYFSICRRLLDTMYGPNYDLTSALDTAILNWLWELDLFYLRAGRLRPETFFGVYSKS